MTLHVEASQWPLLLSALEGDGERSAAERHAADCPACRQAQAQARELLRQLSALPPPPPPTAESLRRASAPLLRELARERGARLRARLFEPAAALVGFLLLVGLSRARASDPRTLALGLSLLGVALWPLRSPRLRLLVLLGSSLLFARAIASRSVFELGHALACSGGELLAAALPLAALGLALRSQGRPPSSARLGAAAAGGALAGQAALVFTCPSHALGHLLLFHAGAVFLAFALGASAGWLLRPRAA